MIADGVRAGRISRKTTLQATQPRHGGVDAHTVGSRAKVASNLRPRTRTVLLLSATVLTATLVRHQDGPGTTKRILAGAASLLGGAAGDFIDRLDGRGVVDHLHAGWFPTFDFADAFITIGVAVYAWGTIAQSTDAADAADAARTGSDH